MFSSLFKRRSEEPASSVRRPAVVRPLLVEVPTEAPAAFVLPTEPANESIGPIKEPAALVVLTFEEDLQQNEELFSIPWDVMGLEDSKDRNDWARSNAVVLQRHGRLGLILCYVAICQGSLLLHTFRQQVSRKKGIDTEHVVTADLLQKIYTEFDRRGKVRIDDGLVFESNSTIHDTHLSEVLRLGMDFDTSDIHFKIRNDGGESRGDIQMRIDAELEVVKSLNPGQALELVAALYAKADSKSVAAGQGQFNMERPFGSFIRLPKERNIELRFQSHPERYGVDIVCRVLGYDGKPLVANDLAGLGFLPSAIELIQEAAYGPGGGVITVGETGSGKTTTINAILTGHPTVQSGHDYAITVEDPPEGRPPKVSQFAVARSVESKKVGEESPFIPVLRATMRMDGDVISPGEIRDADTAQIWQELALTGHKVFATLHAPSPRGAIERLCGRMMGLTPETISGEHVLGAIVFQKRVPQLCPKCKIPAADAWSAGMECKKLKALEGKGLDPASLFVRNMNGCKHCRQGKKGAIVLPEIFNPGMEQRMLLARGQFAEAEIDWRKTRGSTPFTSPEVQGKTCFEIGMYFASVGRIGIDTLDKSVQRILSHATIGKIK